MEITWYLTIDATEYGAPEQADVLMWTYRLAGIEARPSAIGPRLSHAAA
jgi:hypothetical protein